MTRSIRPTLFALLIALVALVASPVRAQPGAEAPARHVVLVSFDGLRADALRSVWGSPLDRMSAASWSARTILPSSTLPSHTSMVSGVDSAVHKVRFNDWKPGRPRLARATIFTEVRRSGGTVQLVVSKAKLGFLVPSGMPLVHLSYPRHKAADVIAYAAKRFADTRPSLLFVHVADPDAVGHSVGWMTPQYLTVVRQIPGLITGLTQVISALGVWDQTLVIVTADHGGHARTHGTSRQDDMTIPWVALGGAARSGTLQRPIAIYDTAATVLYALGIPRPDEWQGRAVEEAIRVGAPERR
jgi:predicted AlkP superfamily pyrophosphatase or phosphodiesterase